MIRKPEKISLLSCRMSRKSRNIVMVSVFPNLRGRVNMTALSNRLTRYSSMISVLSI